MPCRSRKPIAFHVEFELPAGASVGAAIDYIKSALLTECGLRPPEDPMYRFNRFSIDVRAGEKLLVDGEDGE